MLLHLSIRDFVFIEKLDLDFNKGLTVITGQTGSGKSIILEALLFGLGKRSAKHVVRAGADRCQVTLCFVLNQAVREFLIGKIDLVNSDESLIIQRVKTNTGRNKCFVNHKVVTQKILDKLWEFYVECYGQHTYALLFDPLKHVDILDEYGGLLETRQKVAVLYQQWKQYENKLRRLEQDNALRIKEMDYLTHVCKELSDAEVVPGEEAILLEDIEQLKGREKEKKIITEVLLDIKASDIQHVIERSQRRMKQLTKPCLEPVQLHLSESYDHIERAITLLEEVYKNLDTLEGKLEHVEERLHVLRALARKHHCSIAELHQCLDTYYQQLQLLESQNIEYDNLLSTVAKKKEDFIENAKILSSLRQKCALRLEKQTNQVLSLLHMPKAIFKVEINRLSSLGAITGIDSVRFVASINPGSPYAAIDKIASGGELSRFMLGFRTALIDKFLPKVIIFDEIDVGIGGAVAHAIGTYLHGLSRFVQVIIITHQPQVAGKADCHILVEKEQYDMYTTVCAKVLSMQDRQQELARMISGEKITEAALKAAKELLICQSD